MALNDRDRKLGMDRPITRRDFLDGVALTIGASVIGAAGFRPTQARAQGAPAYPPAEQGIQGQTDSAQQVMHAIRDGSFDPNGAADATGEAYDLVVVGAGISGLAAAVLYRQQKPDARVLLIDPLADFGGHAKRNEFTASNGKTLIGYGGSQTMQTPTYWSPAVHQLLRDVGIQVEKFEDYYDDTWAEDRGLSGAIFFDAAQWGVDRLVIRNKPTAEWVAETPLNDTAKAQLIELIESPPDYLPGLTPEQRVEKLASITYRQFLEEVCGYDPQVGDFYQGSTQGYFGVGIDACSAIDARGNWNPGFDGMDLGDFTPRQNSPSGRLGLTDPDPYIYHFPEGNGGVARSLVRALIPAALPGSTMEDLVATPVDYGLLDLPDNAVRLRLNSTAVKVAHDGARETAESVTVTYENGGTLHSVTASHVVLACWHRVIPYLTNEISAEQVAALNDQQKVPLIYTNVQLRNWRALDELKIEGVRARGNFWSGYDIDFPVSVGDYKFADTPDDPVILHLSKVLTEPGLAPREQALAGKRQLYALTFEDLERSIRELLARSLAGTGFDPATDIEAITCNRWAHGYAFEYMWPGDAYWPDGPLPIETARQGWGRIAIANADSGAYAYCHSAIDQATRAVRELIGAPEGAPDFSHFPGPPVEMLNLK